MPRPRKTTTDPSGSATTQTADVAGSTAESSEAAGDLASSLLADGAGAEVPRRRISGEQLAAELRQERRKRRLKEKGY